MSAAVERLHFPGISVQDAATARSSMVLRSRLESKIQPFGSHICEHLTPCIINISRDFIYIQYVSSYPLI